MLLISAQVDLHHITAEVPELLADDVSRVVVVFPLVLQFPHPFLGVTVPQFHTPYQEQR